MMILRWTSKRSAAAPGYGVGILLVACLSMLVMALTLQVTTGSILPKQLQAQRQRHSAHTIALAALPIARDYIQTQINGGTTIAQGFTLTGQTLSAPSDPSNLASAPMALGTYNLTVVRKNGDYYLLRIDATTGGSTDSETRLYKIVRRDMDLSTAYQNIRFMGRNTNDQAGHSATAIGDVDVDGYNDVLIGAPFADGGNADWDNRGESYLVFGRSLADWDSLADASSRVNLSAINGVDSGDNGMIRIIGRTQDDRSGYRGYPAGDVNGDTYDDFLISAETADTNAANAGEVYLIFGRPRKDATYARYDWNELTDASGNITLSAANVNGVDAGDKDMIRFLGQAAPDMLGTRLATAGDVDGDTYDDILLVAPNGDDGSPADTGEVHLIFGRTMPEWNSLTDANGDVTLNGATANGVAAGDNNIIRFLGWDGGGWFGESANGVGDVNGDGYNDILITSCVANANGNDSGEAYLIFGRPRNELITDDPDFPAAAVDWNELTDAAGDVDFGDSDGDDVLDFGIPNGVNDNGAGADDNNIIRFIGAAAGDNFGEDSATPADLDDDGYMDLVIGAYAADPNGSDSGAAYLIFGRSTPAWNALTDASGTVYMATAANGVNTGDNDIIRFTGRTAGEQMGVRVAAGGDVDGDGYQDMLFSAYSADTNGVNIGEAYIVMGRSRSNWNSLTDANGDVAMTGINGVGTGDTNMIRIQGGVSSDFFGLGLSMNQDVNGDQRPDIVISSYAADGAGVPGADRGEAFILCGRSRTRWNQLTDASGYISLWSFW